MSITNIKVRYVETDAMAVVHHANYYVYFEVAREDLIKEKGITYKEMEASGVMMPLVETYCKYMEPAKYDDELIIESTISELSPIKVRIKYIITRKEDNKVLAKGETLQTFINSENFKIINLKRANQEMWEKLNS